MAAALPAAQLFTIETENNCYVLSLISHAILENCSELQCVKDIRHKNGVFLKFTLYCPNCKQSHIAFVVRHHQEIGRT